MLSPGVISLYFAKLLGLDKSRIEVVIILDQDDDDDEEEEDDDGGGVTTRTLNLEAFDCPLREWISEERTRQEIKKRFRKFLVKFYIGIDEVTRHEKRYGADEPLPPGIKKSNPIYPAKIRFVHLIYIYVCICICTYIFNLEEVLLVSFRYCLFAIFKIGPCVLRIRRLWKCLMHTWLKCRH